MAENRFTFTRAKLNDVPQPDEGWVYFYDEAVRGLALGVSATGAKSFTVIRKFKGRPVRIALGIFDPAMPETRELPEGAEPLDLFGNRAALNVRMARKLAMAVMAQLDTGVNPADRRRGMKLGELFERYRVHLVSEGKKGVPGVVWYFERYLGELPDGPVKKHGKERSKAPGAVNWQRRPISEITHQDVARLRLDLADKVGRCTANRVIEVLRAIYNFAKKPPEKLYDGENPAEGFEKFKTASRERFLQPEELQRFFETLDAEPDTDFRHYIKLALFTGARRSNTLKMRWDELNLDGARWRVTGEKMKNGDPLTIRLVEQAVAVLRERAAKAENEWVFPGNTATGHMGMPRFQWERFIKRAGVPDLHLHDLRRSLGSHMAGTGASTVMTMAALGHKSISAALVYQRLAASDPVLGAMQHAVDHIERMANGKPQVVQMPRKARKSAAAGARR